MTRKHAIDPKRIALLDRQQKLLSQFERDYSRMKRAFNRMEKCRAALCRIARRLLTEDAP